MKYKALSKKFRQATGVADPVPAASLLPEEDNQGRSRGNENSVRNEISRGDGSGMEIGQRKLFERQSLREVAEKGVEDGEFSTGKIPAGDILAKQILAKDISTEEILPKEILAREILAREILEACEGSVVSLAAQLEVRLNPAYSPRMENERFQLCSAQKDSVRCPTHKDDVQYNELIL
ncbi:MAG: hypothetical protein IJC66_00995 [Kiritimatiellae bacterium]|nr:hypothetical protein [Kiritimatiellia bacterium]